MEFSLITQLNVSIRILLTSRSQFLARVSWHAACPCLRIFALVLQFLENYFCLPFLYFYTFKNSTFNLGTVCYITYYSYQFLPD